MHIPRNIGHSRRRSGTKLDPAAACQTLATSVGTTWRDAACAGGHDEAQNSNRDRRQPKTDHALDEAAKNEGQENHEVNEQVVHAADL
jgi:hypothetical protein